MCRLFLLVSIYIIKKRSADCGSQVLRAAERSGLARQTSYLKAEGSNPSVVGRTGNICDY
jgi:hypothetical protein